MFLMSVSTSTRTKVKGLILNLVQPFKNVVSCLAGEILSRVQPAVVRPMLSLSLR